MTRRHLASLSCLAVILAFVAPALVAAPASAASWTKISGMHGAQVQGCKVPVDNGWRLKVRLDNDSDHGHFGGVSVSRGGKQVDRANFRVLERRVSKVRSVVVRQGDVLSGGIGEADSGQGHGGVFFIGSIRVC
jgi:hypothetical protein